MADGEAPGARTVAALVESAATRDPGRIALLAPGRAPLGYGELARLIASVGATLRDRGVGPRDRVALVVENGPEAATGFLALASAAAVAPLNPTYRREELDFYLSDLGVSAVVVSRALDSPAREAARELGAAVFELDASPGEAAGEFRLDGELLAPGAGPIPAPGDVALLLHTSGTTSRPKLVPLAHRHVAASAANVAGALELGPDDRCLNLMPLFHVHGLIAALLASVRAGASVACAPGFHALRVFEWLRELEPTWTTAVPTMYQSLLGRAPGHESLLRSHRLRFVRSSSAALPVPVLERLERTLGVPVVEAYGMTEAAHQMASNSLSRETRRTGSVGRAAGPEIAILSPGGEVLPPGSAGEVAIRGENVFTGYLGNAEANAAAFVDGWFRTGDEGRLDAEGFLTLTGRLKEQINRGGEKVSPLEVDERLLAHPAVAQAVTFAMPDDRLGEEVAAAVVLESGADVDEAALQDFAAQTLAPFKVPRTIVLADEIPKGPTGKVQRIGLAERLGVSARPADGAGGRAPRTEPERLVASVWSDVLGVPSVAVDDDFFALGGDSILGAEAVSRLRELTGRDDLPLVSIVRAPTVAGMVRELERGR
jgi:oxalate---CoA ligase